MIGRPSDLRCTLAAPVIRDERTLRELAAASRARERAAASPAPACPGCPGGCSQPVVLPPERGRGRAATARAAGARARRGDRPAVKCRWRGLPPAAAPTDLLRAGVAAGRRLPPGGRWTPGDRLRENAPHL